MIVLLILDQRPMYEYNMVVYTLNNDKDLYLLYKDQS